jgi:two-component sensor histidine kinase
MVLSRTFPSQPSSVPLVRRFVCSETSHLPSPFVADLGLVASELATNAVQHAGTAFDVRLEVGRGEVLLEVSDSGGGVPRLSSDTRRDAPRGRGLRIVETLAADWGVRSANPGPGKTVWARLDG